MVVAVGTVFITLLEFLGIFSEDFLAFFAGECLGFVLSLVLEGIEGKARGKGNDDGNSPFLFAVLEDGSLFLRGILRNRTIVCLGNVRDGVYEVSRGTYSMVI